MRKYILAFTLISSSAFAEVRHEYWSAEECRSALMVFVLEYNGANECLLALPRATLLQVFDRFRRACERVSFDTAPQADGLRLLFLRYFEGICANEQI